MTSKQRDSILRQNLEPTPHDFGENRKVNTLLWKARNGQRGDWGSSHRPHVVDRVERGNATVIKRVVNYRSEEVERLHERQVVAQAVHSCVVGKVEADNQIRVVWLLR